MGDEAVDGSKLGTKLIFFVAIIGLALVAFIVGKSLVNTGVDGLEQSVQAVNDSRYSDYNGKVVRGRSVKSAIQNFSNEEVAIVVATLTYNDTGASSKYTGTGCNVGISNATMKNSSGANVANPAGICYNAQIADKSKSQSASITMENGKAIFNEDFAKDNSGNILYNLDTGALSKKGDIEYIADNASFNANLIQNSAGEICGILFVQKKLN